MCYNLVVFIVLEHKPIAKEKPWIAFSTIWIKNLFPYFHILLTLDDEPIHPINIVPDCLFWEFVI